MTEKGIVKTLTLVLIVSLTISSIVNIAEKSLQYHDSWSSYLVSVGFAVSFSLTVYVVMIAETSLTRRWAIIFAAVFGVVSAWIQTSVYLDNEAAFGVAISYGVGVPGFEAALAILHALLSRESVSNAVVSMTESASPIVSPVMTMPVPVVTAISDNEVAADVVKPVESVSKNVAMSVAQRRKKLMKLTERMTATTDTVAQWAKDFGTSERTIWRDISTLQTQAQSGD